MEGEAVSSVTLTTRLKEQARELGFGLVGVASVEASRHMGLYREWVEDGRHGEMGYLAREDAVARRADLRGTLPTVRSAITPLAGRRLRSVMSTSRRTPQEYPPIRREV